MFRIVSHAIFISAAMAILAGPVMAQDTPAPAESSETVPTKAESQFRLLMVEQVGCVYCRMWEHDLGPIYPKTPEGQIAPLERTDLHKPFPADVTITGGKPVFTPTFILLRDGIEVGRIEGYASEDFFWGLLGQALEKAGAELPDPAG